jgi:hypothetical protein
MTLVPEVFGFRRGIRAELSAELVAAATACRLAEARQGCQGREAHRRAPGVGSGRSCGRRRSAPRGDEADPVQLDPPFRRGRRGAHAARSRTTRAAAEAVRGAASVGGVVPEAAPGRVRLFGPKLDRVVAPRCPGGADGGARLGAHPSTRAPRGEPGVEAPPPRAAARSGPREKNAEFAGKSSDFPRAASSSPKTRPISFSSHPSAPHGRRAASRPRSGSPAAMRAGSSSAPSISGPGIWW